MKEKMVFQVFDDGRLPTVFVHANTRLSNLSVDLL